MNGHVVAGNRLPLLRVGSLVARELSPGEWDLFSGSTICATASK